MVTMKPVTRKIHVSITIALTCILVLIALLYTETISSISPTSVFSLKSCPKRNNNNNAVSKSNKPVLPDKTVDEEVMRNIEADDRFEFDPTECSLVDGKWVFNTFIKPLYSDTTCPYLDRQVSCAKNGRPDSDYLHWEWQLDECILPRFNPKVALEKLRGKRLMFVGDSLQRGQWQSFVCLVEFIIPQDQKSMHRGRSHSIFKAKEYNATIEFYWAPFLVESNSDEKIIGDPKERILRVDSIAKHAQYWIDVDILVFNTYVWWMSGLRINSVWGSFANGMDGFEELEAPVAYNIALKTWANWVDSTIDPNKTRVFFTSMSPTHMRSADWNNKEGIKCYNETTPVLIRKYWGTGSNKNIMKVVNNVMRKMRVPVTLINITQMSEHRIDAHTSVYTETQGKLLTDEQKADPLHYADCIHWCLPGLPDTWNQALLAYL